MLLMQNTFNLKPMSTAISTAVAPLGFNLFPFIMGQCSWQGAFTSAANLSIFNHLARKFLFEIGLLLSFFYLVWMSFFVILLGFFQNFWMGLLILTCAFFAFWFLRHQTFFLPSSIFMTCFKTTANLQGFFWMIFFPAFCSFPCFFWISLIVFSGSLIYFVSVIFIINFTGNFSKIFTPALKTISTCIVSRKLFYWQILFTLSTMLGVQIGHSLDFLSSPRAVGNWNSANGNLYLLDYNIGGN